MAAPDDIHIQYLERIIAEHDRRHQEHVETLRREGDATRAMCVALVTALEQLTSAKFEALALAVKTQDVVMNNRLDGMNEFRRTVERLITEASSKEVVAADFRAINQRFNALENIVTTATTTLAAMVPAVSGNSTAVNSLKETISKESGRQIGVAAAIATIITAIGFLLTILRFGGLGG